jgi:putative transposase
LTYDPAIHHRRSIRLKGHDYAGGGEYFVTICAHRDWIAQEQGRPFHAPGLRELIGRVWESLPDRFPEMGAVGAGLMPSTMSAPMAEKSRHETGTHEGSPYVIMPDHFHGLIALPRGVALGDAMGAFKSLVVRGVVAGVKREEFPPFPGKIWHRNYYEKIVRSEMERAAIEKYIRLNPVRLEFRLEGMAAFGNPNLWEMKKIGVLASGSGALETVPEPKAGWAWLSGFHSAAEEAVLNATDAPAIRMAAVAPEQVGLSGEQLQRLAEGRLLVLCPFAETRTTRENALARNRLIAECSDRLWIPAVRPGGSLEKLKQENKHKLT